jgi:hypothetical protein
VPSRHRRTEPGGVASRRNHARHSSWPTRRPEDRLNANRVGRAGNTSWTTSIAELVEIARDIGQL